MQVLQDITKSDVKYALQVVAAMVVSGALGFAQGGWLGAIVGAGSVLTGTQMPSYREIKARKG